MPSYTVIYGSGPDFMPLLEMVQIYTYIPNVPYTYSCITALVIAKVPAIHTLCILMLRTMILPQAVSDLPLYIHVSFATCICLAAAAQLCTHNMAKLTCIYSGRSDTACGRIRQRDQAAGSESGVAALFTKGGIQRPELVVARVTHCA